VYHNFLSPACHPERVDLLIQIAQIGCNSYITSFFMRSKQVS
jgi:hypothetical protein